MEFSRVQLVLRRHRNVVVFAALVMVVAGLDLLLNPAEPGRVEILSLPFIVGAVLLLALVFWPEVQVVEPAVVERTLGRRFLDRVSFRGRLVPLFPLVGIVLIALDVAYNAFLSVSPALSIHDTVTIIFGLSLVAYPFVPQRFDRERDFILLFFLVLILILVVPLVAFQVAQGNIDNGVNVYSRTMLAPELQGLLRIVGVQTDLFIDQSSGAPGLAFMTRAGQPISVVISTSCSGIYSFSIFASAFTSFVLTEFKKVNRRVWALLLMGFLASYFANLLRMGVIVGVGYFSDTTEGALNSMLIAHSNAGWLIFLGWISLFWVLMYRFLFPKSKPAEQVVRKEARCALCNGPLSPTIVGAMCECGTMYHLECAQTDALCPVCSRVLNRPAKEAESQAQ